YRTFIQTRLTGTEGGDVRDAEGRRSRPAGAQRRWQDDIDQHRNGIALLARGYRESLRTCTDGGAGRCEEAHRLCGRGSAAASVGDDTGDLCTVPASVRNLGQCAREGAPRAFCTRRQWNEDRQTQQGASAAG